MFRIGCGFITRKQKDLIRSYLVEGYYRVPANHLMLQLKKPLLSQVCPREHRKIRFFSYLY